MSWNRLISLMILVTTLSVGGDIAVAEEPVERFLVRLREASLHSLAATYLDAVASAGLIPESLKEDIPLEKLLLLQDSLPTLRSADERAKRSAQIEKGFNEFLEKNAAHPRRSEARIQLADLLLNRGQELMRKSPTSVPSDLDLEKARKAFQESRKLFESTQVELRPILKELQGNKADNAAKVAYRDRLQGEYRQAEILLGLSSKFLGETFPKDSQDYKQWLEKAESELSEVVKKTTGNREAGRHALSLLYQGQVQATLGKIDEAYDSLVRVADIDEAGPFRDWRVQATTQLVRLQLKSPQPKYEPILGRAESLLKSAQAGEKWTTDWIDLQLAIAEGSLAWSAILEGQANGQTKAKAVKADARSILQAIGKRPGPHLEKTRQLLTSIGVEPLAKVDEKVPEVKKFADGFAAARERFDRVNTNNMSNEILRNRLKAVPPAEQPSIEEEIKKNEEASLGDIRIAEGLLRKAIPLFSKEDAREDLAKARYFLSFALLKREAFWESAAVADFVTRNGGDVGLEAGRFALFSYGKLLEESKGDKSRPLAKSLESLAAHMLNTWPNAKESEDAAMTLIQQASSDDRWEDVERYIALLPKEGVKPSQIRREIGVILYARYLIAMDKKRRANEAANEQDKGALERAEVMLASGWKGLTKETLDQRAVECGNSLASIYMKSDRLADAESLLQKVDVGPIVAIHSELNLEPRIKMETLRLLLQSMVLAAGKSGKKLETKSISDIVGEMKKFAVESPEGIGRLSSSLVQLSQDLQDQLNQVKDPADKIKLSDGIQVLLEQLVGVSEDVNILEWSGSTLNTLAQGMESSPATRPQAIQLTKGSVGAFTKLMEIEARKPGTIKEAGRKVEDVQTKFAQALRGQGEFQGAIDKLEGVLSESPKSLLPQFEAAKTYQLWGQSSKSADYYRKAIEGNKKSIWGWGLLSTNLSKGLSKGPGLLEYFFEARYRLADSRYNAGLLEPDPAKKKKALEFSIGDLRSTAIQYPKVKESAWYNSMDQLMRNLQRELGKDQIGMQEFFAETPK